MRTPTNHFKFGVRFDDVAFGEESRRDVALTPLQVAEACEQFAARVRKFIARQVKHDTTVAEGAK